LKNVDASAMAVEDRRNVLQKIQSKAAEQEKLMGKLTATGLSIEKGRVLGISVTTNPIGRSAKDRPWCQIALNSETIVSSPA
jgi:hypothetical protein